MRSLHIALTALAVTGAFARMDAQTGRVLGVVYDSVGRRPLAGAEIELVDASAVGSAPMFRARSDSAGRFEIRGLVRGRYLVDFRHPLLDSLSLDPPTSGVRLDADSSFVSLGVPGLATIARMLCPAGSVSDSTTTLIGHIYDAVTLNGIDGARATLWWRELGIGAGRLTEHQPTGTVTTKPDGAFTFCAVPSNTELGLFASHGADTTEILTLPTADRGVLRRDLFIGRADGGAAADGPVVRGRVVANDGRPLANVTVRVVNTPHSARTGDDGRYELRPGAVGTRLVEMRLLGYAPESRVVDLHSRQSLTLDAKLLTVRQMMDTVRVVGTRVYDRDRNGFSARRRMGGGYFLDANDVEKLRPHETTNLLERAPFVRVEQSGTDRHLTMRVPGNIRCIPTVFVDGMRMENLDTRDLDGWVIPERVAGIEVYTSPDRTPAEFMRPTGCGSIVIWTRQVPPKSPTKP